MASQRTKLEGIKARLGVYMFTQDTVLGIPPETTAASISIEGRTYLLSDDLDFVLKVLHRYEMHDLCPCEAHAAAIVAIKAVPDAHVRLGWWHDLRRMVGR